MCVRGVQEQEGQQGRELEGEAQVLVREVADE
jgi:hypothetical protein